MKYRILAAVALTVIASGCTRKAEGQTVAVVNGEEITAPDLNFALSQARIPDGTAKDAARNQVLQQLVDRRLLAEEARKEGIDKTPDYLNRERLAHEQLLLTMLADRRLNTTQLPSNNEIQNYITTHPGMFANRETWDLDQVAYPTPTTDDLKKQVIGAHSIDALIAVLQQNKVEYKRQKYRVDTASIPPELYSKLATLPAGEPFAVAVGQRSVANSIIAREPHPLTGDQAKPAAVDAIRKTQTGNGLEQMLKSLRQSAKIEYQAGYGPPKKN